MDFLGVIELFQHKGAFINCGKCYTVAEKSYIIHTLLRGKVTCSCDGKKVQPNEAKAENVVPDVVQGNTFNTFENL
jgi:hypothetical protein